MVWPRLSRRAGHNDWSAAASSIDVGIDLLANASEPSPMHGSTPLDLLAIARMAAKLGDLATASKLLRDALPIAHAIRDTETARRISELLAQLLRRLVRPE